MAAPALLAQLQRDAEPKVSRALITLLDAPEAIAVRPALRAWATEALAGSVEEAVKVQCVAVLDLAEDATVLLARLADAMPSVQAAACQRLYAGAPAQIAADPGDPLARPDVPDAVRAACLEGAAQAWCGNAAGAAAAQAVLAREFAVTPRTPQRPAWRAIAALHCPARAVRGGKLPPWLAVLRDVVADPQAGGFARTEAVRTLHALAAPKPWFVQWQRKYTAAQVGTDAMVRRALASVLHSP